MFVDPQRFVKGYGLVVIVQGLRRGLRDVAFKKIIHRSTRYSLILIVKLSVDVGKICLYRKTAVSKERMETYKSYNINIIVG